MDTRDHNTLVKFLKYGTYPRTFKSSKSNFVSRAKKFKLNKKDCLTRSGKIVLKKQDLAQVWSECHSHQGWDKTWNNINDRYYFLGGEKWVREKVKDCVVCSHKNKSTWKPQITPLKSIPVAPKAWWRVHIDLMGPFPKSGAGNKYVVLGVCAFSKYVEAEGNNTF